MQFPDHFNDPELFALLNTYQVHPQKLVGNATRMKIASPMVDILQRKQLLQNHLILNLVMMKSNRFQNREIH